jgi:hypothetical protein
MHDIAQKHIFFFKLPELDLDPDLVVKFPDPDPQHCFEVIVKFPSCLSLDSQVMIRT